MKKVLALLLTAGMILSFTACGKESEQTKEKKKTESATQSEQTVTDTGFEGNWKATDSDESIRIYDLTDKGFKCEFNHMEEGQIENFNYEMEFDNDEKTVASEKGSIDDNGGWEYSFKLEGGMIKVSWQGNEQYYTRVG